jgi:pectate lyase
LIAGTIAIDSAINVASNKIVRGESADAGGICVRSTGGGNPLLSLDGVFDVTISHLRLRPGPTNDGVPGDGVDALQITGNSHDVIVDHCSLSWSVDGIADVYGPSRRVQYRYCIFSEALNNASHSKGEHGYGAMVGGGATEALFYRCLFAHNTQRNPLIQSGRADIINCVAYNWRSVWAHFGCSGGNTQVNFIGNYGRTGPNWDGEIQPVFLLPYDNGNLLEVYADGNVLEGGGRDWDLIRLPSGRTGTATDYRVTERFTPLWDVNIVTASSALEDVLANAGATLPKRDTVDARIVSQVRDQTGTIIDDPSEVGGWPDLTL